MPVVGAHRGRPGCSPAARPQGRGRQDRDGDWHCHGFLLEDHAGNMVEIGERAHALIARAEQTLAARAGRPGELTGLTRADPLF